MGGGSFVESRERAITGPGPLVGALYVQQLSFHESSIIKLVKKEIFFTKGVRV